MRLLICTQAVDTKDPILGFFHAWIEKFAAECEVVTVICLRKGEHALPSNVEVIALGETGKIRRAFEVCTVSWGRRKEYDAVFVHMNPEYIAAAGWLWKFLKKRVGLWYVHKSITPVLRYAEKVVDIIFTVSKDTFPLHSSKIQVTGHGVDTELFKPIAGVHTLFRAVSIGRISAKKNTRGIVESFLAFSHGKENVALDLYGDPVTKEEKEYDKTLKELLAPEDASKYVHFHGSVIHESVPSTLLGASVFVSLSETGGIDKAILEAMAMEIPVITTSSAHAPLLSRYPQLIAHSGDDVRTALEYVYALPHTVRAAIGGDLRQEVVENHSLPKLIKKLTWLLSQSR